MVRFPVGSVDALLAGGRRPRVPANKKPPGRCGSGGCGRTRCGARRQV